MSDQLLSISTDELLKKFGKGKHVPGSGSAAAFQGMISAKLLVTVISLTCDKKRERNYGSIAPDLLAMLSKIEERIFPELTNLFHRDSYHFDRAIKFREARDNANDPAIATNLGRQAETELKIAISIPLDIAALNIELAEMASFIFDYGWKAVRGDSQVALSGAISAIAGCISIINLNLLSFGGDQFLYLEETAKKIAVLKGIYEELDSAAHSKITQLETELARKLPLYKEATEILAKVKSKSYLSESEIENSAIELQQLLWRHRNQIWKDDYSQSPLKILNSAQALQKVLGYKYFLMDNIVLANQEDYTNTAGIIDQRDKLVLISKRYSNPIQNFTTAHELGHAILHSELVMHRDIPIDGSTQSGRSKVEIQADKFASYFLMPRKLMNQVFKELFLTQKFTIDEHSAFNLIKGRPGKLRAECRNLRGLSRKLASAERYNNESFNSLSKLFNVSVETMAIRLEELELLEF